MLLGANRWKSSAIGDSGESGLLTSISRGGKTLSSLTNSGLSKERKLSKGPFSLSEACSFRALVAGAPSPKTSSFAIFLLARQAGWSVVLEDLDRQAGNLGRPYIHDMGEEAAA